MAFQQSDLTTIERAMATGARSVKYADGREASFRGLDELRSTRDQIARELGTAPAQTRVFLAEHHR